MHALPDDIAMVPAIFTPVFSPRAFAHAKVLMIGAVLAPGRRTVSAALRIMGLGNAPHFQNYHRVLNRAVWSSRQAAGLLLRVLTSTFAAAGPLVVGLDETLERRRGPQIKARGVYRDAVRSSRSQVVKASGLRWMCMMLLVPIPWALPFFSVLAPSERYHTERGIPHRTLAEWAGLMVCQLREWVPDRIIVLVADSSYAVLNFLHSCGTLARPVLVVTRLRLDACLYAPAPERKPGAKGRPRKVGPRLPTLQKVLDSRARHWQRLRVPQWYDGKPREVDIVSGTALWYHSGQPAVPIRWVLLRDPRGEFTPQALLCTDPSTTPLQIISWFVPRWQVETTFQAVRTHLGVETQRQWNDLANARTTPALLALFSLVTLMAHPHFLRTRHPLHATSWYHKQLPTFADAIAYVRQEIWRSQLFCMSPPASDNVKLTPALAERLLEALCYAA
jgi:hypothetical protein